MPRSLVVAAIVIAMFGGTFAWSQEKEPENGPELVKVLKDKYGVDAMLDSSRDICIAGVEDAVDLPRAVERIASIPSVRAVEIHWENKSKHVVGKTISRLGRLPKLTFLDVRFCRIDDKDTVALEDLKNLVELRIDGNPITDRALAHLIPIKTLELLYLSETKVTGMGFKNLQSLPKLRNLYLDRTPITDSSLEELGKVQSLRVLVMNGTRLSKDGIRHVTDLYLLTDLSIDVVDCGDFVPKHRAARAEAEKKGLVPKNYPPFTLINH